MVSKGSDSKNKKNKKKTKTNPNALAMKHKAPKPNPFETIWSRSKFDILGKKRKGEEKRIGLSRSKAIEKVICFSLVFNFIFSLFVYLW